MNSVCCICLDTINKDNIITKCNHNYHTSCFNKLLKNNNYSINLKKCNSCKKYNDIEYFTKCAMCRSELPLNNSIFKFRLLTNIAKHTNCYLTKVFAFMHLIKIINNEDYILQLKKLNNKNYGINTILIKLNEFTQLIKKMETNSYNLNNKICLNILNSLNIDIKSTIKKYNFLLDKA